MLLNKDQLAKYIFFLNIQILHTIFHAICREKSYFKKAFPLQLSLQLSDFMQST